MVVGLVATRGRAYLQLEKTTIGKIKTKKGLCTIGKNKN